MATATKPRGRPFVKGGPSPNPSGRPQGSRNTASITLDRIMEADSAKIARAVVALAKRGDLRAAELVLSRTCPVPRDRRLFVSLPPTDTAAGVEAASRAILAAVAGGELRPSEAVALSALLDGRRRALELGDIARRVEALEQRTAR